MKKILYILFVSAAITSCKNSVELYENDPRLNFAADSTVVSFIFNPNKNEIDAEIKILTMGIPSDGNREFKVSQIEVANRENAILDTHYKIDDASLVIKAGETEGLLKVSIVKTADMEDGEVVLKLVIEENGDFKIGIPEKGTHLLKMTNKPSKPTDWTQDFLNPNHKTKDRTFFNQFYFGAYSASKLQFLVEKLGIVDFRGDANSVKVWGVYESLAIEEYQKYLDGGNTPLLDDNGNEISMGGIK